MGMQAGIGRWSTADVASVWSALVADEVDGAAAVDVQEVHLRLVRQQLGAAHHGVHIPPTHLHSTRLLEHSLSVLQR